MAAELVSFNGTKARLLPPGEEIFSTFEKGLSPKKKDDPGPDFTQRMLDYLEIFPNIKLPSNKMARVNVKNIDPAFRWFLQNYEYSWDVIYEATTHYVEEYRRKNYNYMQTSQYFIRKQQTDKTWLSELANYCELVVSGGLDNREKYFKDTVV